MQCARQLQYISELRTKVLALRDLIDLPPCISSASVNELVIATVTDLCELYPDAIPRNSMSEIEATPTHQALASFCDALKSVAEMWMNKDECMDKSRRITYDNMETIELQHALRMLDEVTKIARERFSFMDEDDDSVKAYSPRGSCLQINAFGRAISKSYSENRGLSGSPATATSVLPMITSPGAPYSSYLLLPQRVQAVVKLNPIDIKHLSFQMLPLITASEKMNETVEEIKMEKEAKDETGVLTDAIGTEDSGLMGEEGQLDVYSPQTNAFGRASPGSYSERETASGSAGSLTSVLPDMTSNSRAPYSSRLLSQRVQAVKKLNPIDIKHLSFQPFPHIATEQMNEAAEEIKLKKGVMNDTEVAPMVAIEEIDDCKLREDISNKLMTNLDELTCNKRRNWIGNPTISPVTKPETLARCAILDVLLPPLSLSKLQPNVAVAKTLPQPPSAPVLQSAEVSKLPHLSPPQPPQPPQMLSPKVVVSPLASPPTPKLTPKLPSPPPPPKLAPKLAAGPSLLPPLSKLETNLAAGPPLSPSPTPKLTPLSEAEPPLTPLPPPLPTRPPKLAVNLATRQPLLLPHVTSRNLTPPPPPLPPITTRNGTPPPQPTPLPPLTTKNEATPPPLPPPPPPLMTRRNEATPPPPPPPPPMTTRNEASPSAPPPPPLMTRKNEATPPPPPPPPPMTRRNGATPPPPPPPTPMTAGNEALLLPPPPPPPMTKRNGATPPPPPTRVPMTTGNGTTPPPPQPPLGISSYKSAPSPPPSMPLAKGTPPPPPTLGGTRFLYPKKAASKLKRSPQMGNLYRNLKEKVEGSSLDGISSQGTKRKFEASTGAKQGMAEAIAEMTKKSAYFQQIEEDVKNHAKTIIEVKVAITNFQTTDMAELLKFHKFVESHLGKLADESQVLARFESFPAKKLEALRMGGALYSKLDTIANTLQNWKIEAPLGQLLDKVESYFNKIKGEIDKLERNKDEESKKLQSQKINFDFGILVKIKELMVDISSSCMEMALKEKRETMAKENKQSGYKTERQKMGSGQMLWRTFQFTFRIYSFAGGQDDRAEKLTIELAHEIEIDLLTSNKSSKTVMEKNNVHSINLIDLRH